MDCTESLVVDVIDELNNALTLSNNCGVQFMLNIGFLPRTQNIGNMAIGTQLCL